MAISRLRAPRGLTLVEMAVVLALFAILMAVTLPRLAGTRGLAEDQKAQTTASAALDTAVAAFLDAGDRDGEGCNATASAPRQQLDPGPYSVDLASPTSCPVFANAADLAAANGDVEFVAGDVASTGTGLASVAARNSPAGWRVAVAVLAPQEGTAGGTTAQCWMAWHQFPPGDVDGAAGGGVSLERYFTQAAGTADVCTADAALALEPQTSCAAGTEAVTTPGTSWRHPCTGA